MCEYRRRRGISRVVPRKEIEPEKELISRYEDTLGKVLKIEEYEIYPGVEDNAF
jgi:hypothetical protein